MRALIRRLSEENRLWGTERIRGELLPQEQILCQERVAPPECCDRDADEE